MLQRLQKNDGNCIAFTLPIGICCSLQYLPDVTLIDFNALCSFHCDYFSYSTLIETFEGGRRNYLKQLSTRESSYPNRPFIMSPSSLPKKVLVGFEGKVRRAWDIGIHAAFKMKEEEVQVELYGFWEEVKQ